MADSIIESGTTEPDNKKAMKKSIVSMGRGRIEKQAGNVRKHIKDAEVIEKCRVIPEDSIRSSGLQHSCLLVRVFGKADTHGAVHRSAGIVLDNSCVLFWGDMWLYSLRKCGSSRCPACAP